MPSGREMARERAIAEHVPYTRHVDDQTLRTKDGHLVTILKFDGFCFQTADQDDINLRHEARNTLVKGLNDSRFGLYSHIVRREVHPELEGEFDIPFAAELDRLYRADLKTQRMFANDLYVSIIRRGFQGKVGWADLIGRQARRFAGVDGKELEAEALKELRDVASNFERSFAAYGARILKVMRREKIGRDREGAGVFSEPAEFLAQLLNGGEERPMLLPRMGLDCYLPTKRILFGKKAMEFQGAGAEGTRFGAMISVREYPAYSGPGMFDGLMQMPREFILTQSFAIEDRAPAMSHIAKVERQIAASDEAGTVAETDLITSRDQIAGGAAILGRHHLTVLALGRSLASMERCVSDVTNELNTLGMTSVREDLNAQAAFWAQLPGNFPYIARRSLISSRNFVGFVSLHNFAAGKKAGNRWGPAISVLQTTSQTPYYFNFHRRQVGNFTVVGPTGSGKTVALSFLMAQGLRVRPRPRCAFFDKDRGAEIFIRALGGQYEVLSPGEPSGFNPLQLEGTPSDREFLTSLLSFMVRPRDGSDHSASEEKTIAEAVAEIFKQPTAERRLADVPTLLSGRDRADQNDLASRFDPWLKRDQRGWLFNNETDRWSSGNGIFGFDITKVLDDDDIRTAALGYIFHRVEALLDGSPMMIFIDEGWRVLKDEKFSAFVTDKLKTIRKLNGIVGFGTQSARDIVRSGMSHTLLEQTPTNIFFPNPKADDESYIEAFKCSSREVDWIRSTVPEARAFLIKHDQDSVIAKLDLAAMPGMVKVLSGTVDTVAECAELRARYGEDPVVWLPIFMGKEAVA
ncbi:type IV secretion system protein VirB4 [Rhizobiales bacterium GAS191]|nr:type IV secretion system protein VirB4 [Rhizobiales bacterium GAS191]